MVVVQPPTRIRLRLSMNFSVKEDLILVYLFIFLFICLSLELWYKHYFSSTYLHCFQPSGKLGLNFRIFIPCAILSTESSKQRLTFLLDRQFFASLSFDLAFKFCISHSFDLSFPFFEVKIFQLTSVSWFCL